VRKSTVRREKREAGWEKSLAKRWEALKLERDLLSERNGKN